MVDGVWVAEDAPNKNGVDDGAAVVVDGPPNGPAVVDEFVDPNINGVDVCPNGPVVPDAAVVALEPRVPNGVLAIGAAAFPNFSSVVAADMEPKVAATLGVSALAFSVVLVESKPNPLDDDPKNEVVGAVVEGMPPKVGILPIEDAGNDVVMLDLDSDSFVPI